MADNNLEKYVGYVIKVLKENGRKTSYDRLLEDVRLYPKVSGDEKDPITRSVAKRAIHEAERKNLIKAEMHPILGDVYSLP